MKPTLYNPYGYKVCYKERNKPYKTKFITHSYKQAVKAKQGYVRYPLEFCNKKVVWHILPISRKEVKNGIWRQSPF